ncbi:hypothetical protein BKA66DRAFT_568618 [Pyrenochaeta sp. MPI-SDFR-AT-0127]|nr:hypothetical protein BKA66DRAFT_568618 [Pyrenochaeta sp. MPI-SDFR-AT-0127]
MKSTILVSLAAALPAAHGIAFGGPAPTAASPERAMDGTNPMPTKGPSVSELRKRQANLFPETCGWIDGVYSSAVTCNLGRTCMLYKSLGVGMAGCCEGSDTQTCGWSNRCVDYKAFAAGDCGSNCISNNFIWKCTNSLQPYCVTWTYPSDGLADFGCASTSSNTIYTVLQRATDNVGDTTSMSLPTVSGNAVTGYKETTTGGNTQPTNGYTGGSGSTTGTSRRTKKIAIGLIVGIVIVILFVIFAIIVGVIFFLKKKKKQQQLAANAQVVAAAQANRPQSMFPPQQAPMQMQQPMQGGFVPPPNPQQGGFVPPMSPQSPQPTLNGYFPPPGQNEQKYDPHVSVHEYGASPISNPPTPAPAYSQPHGKPVAPPMPANPNVQAYYHTPADGAHEVDAIGVSRPPPQGYVPPVAPYQNPVVGAHEVDASSMPHAPQQSGPVYEMGHGK